MVDAKGSKSQAPQEKRLSFIIKITWEGSPSRQEGRTPQNLKRDYND